VLPVPTGPSVMVLPRVGKPFDQFQVDDTVYQQFAETQTGVPPGEARRQSTINTAALGTLLGAGVGAAIGAAAGNASLLRVKGEYPEGELPRVWVHAWRKTFCPDTGVSCETHDVMVYWTDPRCSVGQPPSYVLSGTAVPVNGLGPQVI
jgi:hypothetical protein